MHREPEKHREGKTFPPKFKRFFFLMVESNLKQVERRTGVGQWVRLASRGELCFGGITRHGQ